MGARTRPKLPRLISCGQPILLFGDAWLLRMVLDSLIDVRKGLRIKRSYKSESKTVSCLQCMENEIDSIKTGVKLSFSKIRTPSLPLHLRKKKKRQARCVRLTSEIEFGIRSDVLYGLVLFGGPSMQDRLPWKMSETDRSILFWKRFSTLHLTLRPSKWDVKPFLDAWRTPATVIEFSVACNLFQRYWRGASQWRYRVLPQARS